MEVPRISRRRLIQYGMTLAGVSALAGTAYTTLIEPGWLDVSRVSLTLPHLDASFHGYRVAQISDIHLGDWMNAERLSDVARAVNAETPDLIAITGDFVTTDAEHHAPDLADGLRKLRARDGVVAVLGNHDYWSNPQVVRQALVASNIHELANATKSLRRGAAQLHIAGVDDIWEEHDRIELITEALPENGAAILLAHEPDFADESAATGRFDLQISGHSHGGQIIAPFIGPLHLPHFARKYPIGQYQVREMIQYTNRGVGMIRPYVRFNCRPEITIYTLNAPSR